MNHTRFEHAPTSGALETLASLWRLHTGALRQRGSKPNFGESGGCLCRAKNWRPNPFHIANRLYLGERSMQWSGTSRETWVSPRIEHLLNYYVCQTGNMERNIVASRMGEMVRMIHMLNTLFDKNPDGGSCWLSGSSILRRLFVRATSGVKFLSCRSKRPWKSSLPREFDEFEAMLDEPNVHAEMDATGGWKRV